MRENAPTPAPPPADGPTYPELRGRRALVLGGSRGIGRAIALRLAREGMHVLVNYARSAEAAEATAADCRAVGVDAEAVEGDVGDAEALASVFRHAESWGGLDALVNNAARGLERPRPAVDQRPKHLHRTMDINLFGPWQAAQLAVPMMGARGGGAIVNLLSPGAFRYMPDYSAVGVSKAALASLTMYLAVELAPRGIRVNGVSAGWVEGSEGEHSYREAVSDRMRPHVPAGRNVSPEDIAAAVAWVVSDQAPMLVGQTIHLDGGFNDASLRPVLG
jgi:enoyl-[acyl-carrier protein] reductase III